MVTENMAVRSAQTGTAIISGVMWTDMRTSSHRVLHRQFEKEF